MRTICARTFHSLKFYISEENWKKKKSFADIVHVQTVFVKTLNYNGQIGIGKVRGDSSRPGNACCLLVGCIEESWQLQRQSCFNALHHTYRSSHAMDNGEVAMLCLPWVCLTHMITMIHWCWWCRGRGQRWRCLLLLLMKAILWCRCFNSHINANTVVYADVNADEDDNDNDDIIAGCVYVQLFNRLFPFFLLFHFAIWPSVFLSNLLDIYLFIVMSAVFFFYSTRM